MPGVGNDNSDDCASLLRWVWVQRRCFEVNVRPPGSFLAVTAERACTTHTLQYKNHTRLLHVHRARGTGVRYSYGFIIDCISAVVASSIFDACSSCDFCSATLAADTWPTKHKTIPCPRVDPSWHTHLDPAVVRHLPEGPPRRALSRALAGRDRRSRTPACPCRSTPPLPTPHPLRRQAAPQPGDTHTPHHAMARSRLGVAATTQ